MNGKSGTIAAVSRNDAYTFTKPNRDEIVLVAGLGVEGDVHAGVNVRHRSRVKADPTQPNLRQVHLIQAELFAEVAEKGFDVPAGGLGENVTTRGLDLLGMSPGTVLRFGTPVNGVRGDDRAPGGRGATPSAPAKPGVDGPESDRLGADGPESDRLGADEPESDRPGADGPESDGPRTAGSADGGGGRSALAAVLAAAQAATLDEATARAVAAVAAAAERDAGDDPRPAIVLAGLRNPCAQINGFRSGLLKEVLGQDAGGNVVRRAGVMAVVLRGGVVRPGDPVVAEPPPGSPVPLERV